MTYRETITWRNDWLFQRQTRTYWLLLREEANRWHPSHKAIAVTVKMSMSDGSTHHIGASLLHLDGRGSDILGNDLSGPRRALVLPETIWMNGIAEVELELADPHTWV